MYGHKSDIQWRAEENASLQVSCTNSFVLPTVNVPILYENWKWYQFSTATIFQSSQVVQHSNLSVWLGFNQWSPYVVFVYFCCGQNKCAHLTSSGNALRHQAAARFHGLALLAQLLIGGHVGRGWGVSWDIKRQVSEDETSCCCWQMLTLTLSLFHSHAHSPQNNHVKICTPGNGVRLHISFIC